MRDRHLKISLSDLNSKIKLERTVEDTDSEAIKSKKLDFRQAVIGLIVYVLLMFLIPNIHKIPEAIQGRKEKAEAIAIEQKIQEELNAGKIRAFSSKDQEDKDYEAVEEYLRELGFTNIVAIDMHETGIDFWNSGEVISIAINGNENITPDDMYFPDDKVIIKYK